jgi:hypothetical protein
MVGEYYRGYHDSLQGYNSLQRRFLIKTVSYERGTPVEPVRVPILSSGAHVFRVRIYGLGFRVLGWFPRAALLDGGRVLPWLPRLSPRVQFSPGQGRAISYERGTPVINTVLNPRAPGEYCRG